MPTWRCPGCGTVQADSALCFLCLRSATSCGTCADFRRAVVNGIGYCANDRRREPLTGAEQRACWTAGADVAGEGLFALGAGDTGQAPAGRLIEISGR